MIQRSIACRSILARRYETTITISRRWNKLPGLRGITWRALMTNRCTIIAIRIIVDSTLISITSTMVILCLPLCVLRSSPLTKNCVAMNLLVKSSEVELRMQTKVSIKSSGPCAARSGITFRSGSSMRQTCLWSSTTTDSSVWFRFISRLVSQSTLQYSACSRKSIGSASMKTNRLILCSESNNVEETASNGFEVMLSSFEKILTSTVLESRIRISIEWWCYFAYLWFCGLHKFIFDSFLSFVSLFVACRLRFDVIAVFVGFVSDERKRVVKISLQRVSHQLPITTSAMTKW